MRHPWANIALLVLLAAELVTGAAGLVNGADRLGWILWLHSIGAYAVLLLIFWKGQIIAHVLGRRRIDARRSVFLAMTVLALLVLGAGLAWTWTGPRVLLGFSLMTAHVILALGLAALLLWHILARRSVFRVRYASDRRAFLRLTGISVGGLVLWQAFRASKAALALPGAAARFTGSYVTDSLPAPPGQFPTVSWLFDNPAPVAVQDWRLSIGGAVNNPVSLSYDDLRALAKDSVEAIIDCTGGWYSSQAWSGISLSRLLEMCGVRPEARSITVRAVSGYDRRFAVAEAPVLLLALAVARQPLDHGHGFPARLVAPGHRGFEWVKWVTEIEVNDTGHLWQPPVPLQ